mmetsp:Transcript_7225/g.14858  ORF Transcript_7225/g.14858 Transcript_7225/m.14858 type:complete len:94 (-) Transcript_7225:1476-1757(-)
MPICDEEAGTSEVGDTESAMLDSSRNIVWKAIEKAQFPTRNARERVLLPTSVVDHGNAWQEHLYWCRILGTVLPLNPMVAIQQESWEKTFHKD